MTTDTPPTDGSGNTYTCYYGSDEPDQPLTAIVQAVSAMKGVDVRELEPIYYSIDIERLNGLAGRHPSTDRGRPTDPPTELMVTFEYEGCRITVGDEHVSVTRA